MRWRVEVWATDTGETWQLDVEAPSKSVALASVLRRRRVIEWLASADTRFRFSVFLP